MRIGGVMNEKQITIQFCNDKRISKTQCLLMQNKDNSWTPLMYFKKGKHSKQADFDHIIEHFKFSFNGSC